MQPKLIIGTRGSPLALAQTHWIRARLAAACADLREDGIAIEVITTTGDRIQDRALAPIGGKGLFTQEIEARLLDGGIDLAVHSMKDMPGALPEGLMLGPVPARADARDALIARNARTIADLPQGAHVGTASLRRQAQLLARRPDLRISLLRGNVGTRLRKVEDGALDATVLACAGLARLGIGTPLATPLAPAEMLPAPGQGALALEIRAGDQAMRARLDALADPGADACVRAERAALVRLGGDCRTPLGVHARIEGGQLIIDGELLSPDGRRRHHASASGAAAEAEALGIRVGADLWSQGSDLLDTLAQGGA